MIWYLFCVGSARTLIFGHRLHPVSQLQQLQGPETAELEAVDNSVVYEILAGLLGAGLLIAVIWLLLRHFKGEKRKQ